MTTEERIEYLEKRLGQMEATINELQLRTSPIKVEGDWQQVENKPPYYAEIIDPTPGHVVVSVTLD